MDNKYNNLFYWENLLVETENIWSGNFKDIPISQKSLFINTTIIDYEKNIFDNNWAVYPDVKSLSIYGRVNFFKAKKLSANSSFFLYFSLRVITSPVFTP